MKQRLANQKLKWWQGILLILGIVGILMIAQLLASMYSFISSGQSAYAIASVAFWIFGGVVALYIVRAFIMEYEYVIEGLTFRVDRIYGGGRPRMAVSIITRSILFVGTPEEANANYPNTHHTSFTRKKCQYPVVEVVYKVDNSVKAIQIQPEPMIYDKLKSFLQK